jgi:hypothetical protein
MTVNLSLTVNDASIKTDYFVAGFIDHTVSGMMEALKGTGKIKDLALTIEGDNVVINLNGVPVPTNVFTTRIIKNTMIGMVSDLKGVDGAIKKLSIVIKNG